MNCRDIRDEIRSKIVQVVAELFQNVLDHNSDPINGKISVYVDQFTKAITIQSEGEASRSSVDRLQNRVESLKKPEASSIDARLEFRKAKNRGRGRGIIWAARNVAEMDGEKMLSFDRDQNSCPGRDHYRFSATYLPDAD